MTTVETTAIADDETHLVLAKPLTRMPTGPVKVIVMLADEDALAPRQLGHLEGRATCQIGSRFAMTDEELLGA